MRYTEEQKEGFEARLNAVKNRLKSPQFKSYGAVLVALNPELKFRQIYNVIHCGTKNLPILEALERLVGLAEVQEVSA